MHDVLKNDLGGGVMPCGRFFANAAWWRLNCLCYNVISVMKRKALPQTLQRERLQRCDRNFLFPLFVLGRPGSSSAMTMLYVSPLRGLSVSYLRIMGSSPQSPDTPIIGRTPTTLKNNSWMETSFECLTS